MAGREAGSGPLQVSLDPDDFARLMRDIRSFSPELSKATRRELRAAGSEAVKDVQRRLMGRPHVVDAGLARGLARGTGLSIRTAGRAAGVAVETTGAKLPAGKRSMVYVFNRPSCRHPVFGRSDQVTQRGYPYFDNVLGKRKRTFQEAMERALIAALHTMSQGQVK